MPSLEDKINNISLAAQQVNAAITTSYKWGYYKGVLDCYKYITAKTELTLAEIRILLINHSQHDKDIEDWINYFYNTVND